MAPRLPLELGGKLDALLDGAVQFRQSSFEKPLLEVVEFSQAEIFLQPVLSEEDRGCEELGLGDVGVDVRALDDALLAVQALDDGIGEPGSVDQKMKTSQNKILQKNLPSHPSRFVYVIFFINCPLPALHSKAALSQTNTKPNKN